MLNLLGEHARGGLKADFRVSLGIADINGCAPNNWLLACSLFANLGQSVVEGTVMRLFFALFLIAPCVALAQSPPPTGGSMQAGPPVMIQGIDYAPFFSEVDSNRDGKIAPSEWTATGIADRAYTLFESVGDQELTLSDMNAYGAFPGIDANDDTQVTLSEFQAFDQQRRNMGPGGAPPSEGVPPAGN